MGHPTEVSSDLNERTRHRNGTRPWDSLVRVLQPLLDVPITVFDLVEPVDLSSFRLPPPPPPPPPTNNNNNNKEDKKDKDKDKDKGGQVPTRANVPVGHGTGKPWFGSWQ